MPWDIVLGVVTVIMALLGATVSLHPPESLHAPGKWRIKVCYATAFAVLGSIAIVCVVKQSRETATASQNLTNVLGNLDLSTQEIARMTILNTQLQERLLASNSTILGLTKENINTVTGGDSFCYLWFYPNVGTYLVVAYQSGKFPLRDVRGVIRDRTHATDQDDFNVGEIAVGQNRKFYLPRTHDDSDQQDFEINYHGLNGFWSEIVHLRRIKGVWLEQIKVTRYKNKKPIVFEKHDVNYPIEP